MIGHRVLGLFPVQLSSSDSSYDPSPFLLAEKRGRALDREIFRFFGKLTNQGLGVQ